MMPALHSRWLDTRDGMLWEVDRVDERGILLVPTTASPWGRWLINYPMWTAQLQWLVAA